MANQAISAERQREIRELYAELGDKTAVGKRLGIGRDTVKKYVQGVTPKPPESQADKSDAAIVAEVALSGKDKLTTKEDGNLKEATTFSLQFRNLDEWLAALEIDVEEWTVESAKPNTWQMAMKDKNKEPLIVQVYQFKATLKRRKPVAVEPVIQPVNVSVKAIKWSQLPKNRSTRIKTAMIWPDMQVGFKRVWGTGELLPFHDRAAVDLALQIAAQIRPDRHVNLGDNLDLPEWSDKFLCSPDCYWTTQPAVYELAWIYGKQRAITPDGEIDWILGNHDQRFLNTVVRQMKQAYQLRPADDPQGPPLMSLERLIGAEQLGIKLSAEYPHGEVWLGRACRASHGWLVRSGSGSTVAAAANELRCNEIFGHIHRAELAYKTFWAIEGPRTYYAASPGTLASLDPNRVPAHSSRNNWQQAAMRIEYEEDGTFSTPTIWPMFNGSCIADGRLFTARPEAEIVDELIAATKFNFRKVEN